MPWKKVPCPKCGKPIDRRSSMCWSCWKSPEAAAERFWSYVDKTPGHGPMGECWIWTGAKDKLGYGVGSGGRSSEHSYRVSYRLAHGEIPDGLQVLHACDNPPCVRPDHLFLGTQADNMRDMASKGRHPNSLKTHCRNGHAYSEHAVIYHGSRHCKTCRTERERKRVK